jgi:hypothetical protein
MPLSWNEIKSKALQFTQEWKDEVSEDAEAKSFGMISLTSLPSVAGG